MDHIWIDGTPNVPDISDETLHERMQRMQPVVLRGKTLWSIKPVDPRTIAFTWEPVPLIPVSYLSWLAEIQTDHFCGYHAFFKPSIAEVLAQIPEEFLPRCIAFRVDTDREVGIYKSAAAHRAHTVLYGRLS